jgi:hypothetical protein
MVCCKLPSLAGKDSCASCRLGRGRGWSPEESFRASLFKALVEKCATKYQDREKLPVKSILTAMALDVQKFNGSLLELRGMMLTGVTVDDFFRIAVARHLHKFKPNSNVPGEADVYLYLAPHHSRLIAQETWVACIWEMETRVAFSR